MDCDSQLWYCLVSSSSASKLVNRRLRSQRTVPFVRGCQPTSSASCWTGEGMRSDVVDPVATVQERLGMKMRAALGPPNLEGERRGLR